MLLRYSQISMRHLCSDMLFKLIDYILVTCLTKCLSWLVGVQLSPCSTRNWIYIIFVLLSFIPEGVIDLWEVTSSLGLKKWLKFRGRRHNIGHKHPSTLEYPCYGSIQSSLDAFVPISSEHLRVKWYKILVGPREWLVERLGWFLGDMLLMWKVCMVCFHRFRFLEMT